MEKERTITDSCNERVFESELLNITITDFWDFEDDNGISISGPYGVDVEVKGFVSPKYPTIRGYVCASKSFNKYTDVLSYLYVRLKTFQRSLKENLDFFKEILINEEYKGVKDSSNDKDFLYKFSQWGKCTRSTICNLRKYDDEMNCKFTPMVTISLSLFRANGNSDYAENEKKIPGIRDWLFLMKDHSNNCEQSVRNIISFLEDALEDIEPVFEWIVNVFNDRGNLNDGLVDKKLNKQLDKYVYNKPQMDDPLGTVITKKEPDPWSDENTNFYNDEAFEDDNIPF